MDYYNFLQNKTRHNVSFADLDNPHISNVLFPFQRDCVKFSLKKGRAALFCDTGLGKTIMQCEWARHIKGKVLFVAPLAVAQQTCNEAKRMLNIDIMYSKDGICNSKYTITNYERLHLFNASLFDAVVLDESSILKNKNSKTRVMLCEMFSKTPYRLACTATPAPNDYTELGNHAEFLGVMTQQEMLTKWFIHDSANTADWRIKGHAIKSFWQWVASWAACISKPSDLGYSNEGYDLPPLDIKTHLIDNKVSSAFDDGLLFDICDVSATSINQQIRKTINERIDLVCDIVNKGHETFIVWCESNEESSLLHQRIHDSVEVKGADTLESKEDKLMAFTNQQVRVIVSKPSICGHGMNWQHCNRQVFCSTRYSYEYFYQAVRRSYRFGQKKPVYIDVLVPQNALKVWEVINRKANDHDKMKEYMKYAIFNDSTEKDTQLDYNPTYTGSVPMFLM